MLALIDQGPIIRFIKNFWSGRMLGLFHPRSHYTNDGKPKMGFNTKETAARKQEEMTKKRGVPFKNYRCIYCGRYHLGANRYMEQKK